MTIEIENKISIKEINGKKCELDGKKLIVKSHWNESRRVVLECESKNITVLAKDLQAAILNATNKG